MTTSPPGPNEDLTIAIRCLLNRTALAAYRHRAAVARQLDISESEVAALSHLAEGGLTPGELGRRLQLTSGGMTSVIQRLHRRGHIARAPHARDKRKVVITANAKVLEDLSNQYAPVIVEADAITEGFSECEREVVLRYLTRIAISSERFAEQAVADADADAVIPDDALHLWA